MEAKRLLPFAPMAVVVEAGELKSPAGYALRVENYEELKERARREWEKRLGKEERQPPGEAFPYLLRLIMAQAEAWKVGQRGADEYFIQLEPYLKLAPIERPVEWAYYVLLYKPPEGVGRGVVLWESISAPYLLLPVSIQRWGREKGIEVDSAFLGIGATLLARGDMGEGLLQEREWIYLYALRRLAEKVEREQLLKCLQEATSLHAMVVQLTKYLKGRPH